MTKKIELLAPAGNIEKLKFAYLYGADACYIGGRDYSLRANAKNFSIEEIQEAVKYAHNLNKKVYVTVNIVFHNEDIKGIKEYLIALSEAKVDAIIVSDPSVIDIVRDNNIDLKIHISTQASTLNYESVLFWKSKGVERVVLAREVSKEEIKEIIDLTSMEIETFVHGAMCSSYSGRCVLSNYFTNRDANRGGCAQICRWEFPLYDKDNYFFTKYLLYFNTSGLFSQWVWHTQKQEQPALHYMSFGGGSAPSLYIKQAPLRGRYLKEAC